MKSSIFCNLFSNKSSDSKPGGSSIILSLIMPNLELLKLNTFNFDPLANLTPLIPDKFNAAR